MSWTDFWLRTIAQSALSTVVSVLVGLYIKRIIRLNHAEVERVVQTVEAVIGTTLNLNLEAQEKKMFDPAVYRKAFAAGFGVVLTGLLTWAESANLEPFLAPHVPEMFRPLIGVVLGGIALTASVILAKNEPSFATATATAASPAGLSSSDSTAEVVAAAITTSTSPTSIVSLLPAPSASYL